MRFKMPLLLLLSVLTSAGAIAVADQRGETNAKRRFAPRTLPVEPGVSPVLNSTEKTSTRPESSPKAPVVLYPGGVNNPPPGVAYPPVQSPLNAQPAAPGTTPGR